MEKRSNFYPCNVGILLVFATLCLLWLRFIRHNVFSLLAYINLFLFFYSCYYFFILSRIVILDDKLILPKTSYKGFPLAYIFIKRVVEIKHISKIIRYRSQYGQPFATYKFNYSDDKISIIVKGSESIQLSYNFYGDEQIEGIIGKILEKNENIQTIEHGT